MGYLDDLKKICSEMTEVASDRATIDKCAEMSVTINKLEEEHNTFLKDYDELKGAYKQAVTHNSFGSNKPADDEVTPKPISFENVLQEFITKQKENK